MSTWTTDANGADVGPLIDVEMTFRQLSGRASHWSEAESIDVEQSFDGERIEEFNDVDVTSGHAASLAVA